MKFKWSIILLFLLPLMSSAAIPTLNNLSQSEVDDVFEEFSSNIIHRSVTPASQVGNKVLPFLGLEVGLIAGLTDSNDIEKIVKREDPGSDFDSLYHAAISVQGSTYWGLGFELGFIPNVEVADVSFKNWNVGLKWTMTDLFREEGIANWPLDFALRASWTRTRLRYSQDLTVSVGAIRESTPVELTFRDTIWDVGVLASREFFGFFEPYIGLGVAFADADLNAVAKPDARLSVIASAAGIAAEQTVSSNPSSMNIQVGAQMSLLWALRVGAQYSNVFGGDSWTFKLAGAF